MASARKKREHLELRKSAVPQIRKIVSDWLLPRIGWEGPFELTPVANGHNLVYYLESDGRERLVVRAGKRRSKFRRRIRLHRYLLRRGVSVPEFRAVRAGYFVRPLDGFFVSAETCFPGDSIIHTDDPEATAERSGAVFARLHGIRPFPTRLFPRSLWTTSRIEAWLRDRVGSRIAAHAEVDEAEAHRMTEWVEAWPRSSWRHTPRLCLDDVGTGNVIGNAESAGIVDVVGLRVGSAPVELGRVRHMLLRSRRDLWAAFLRSYLAEAEPSLRKEVEAFIRFGEVLYLLRHTTRRGVLRRDDRCYGCLLELLDSTPGR